MGGLLEEVLAPSFISSCVLFISLGRALREIFPLAPLRAPSLPLSLAGCLHFHLSFLFPSALLLLLRMDECERAARKPLHPSPRHWQEPTARAFPWVMPLGGSALDSSSRAGSGGWLEFLGRRLPTLPIWALFKVLFRFEFLVSVAEIEILSFKTWRRPNSFYQAAKSTVVFKLKLNLWIYLVYPCVAEPTKSDLLLIV